MLYLQAPQAHGIVPKKLELGVSELFPNCGAKNILEVLLSQVSKPRSWTRGGESWEEGGEWQGLSALQFGGVSVVVVVVA